MTGYKAEGATKYCIFAHQIPLTAPLYKQHKQEWISECKLTATRGTKSDTFNTRALSLRKPDEKAAVRKCHFHLTCLNETYE